MVTDHRPHGNNKPPRSCVLAVGHHDGFLEFFSDGVDVKFVNIPMMSSSAGEIMAEQYIESVITQRYRDIYFPGNRICAGQMKTTTPLDLLEYAEFVEAWRAVDAIHATYGKRAS